MPQAASAAPPSTERIMALPAFIQLRNARRALALKLTVAMLAIYYGFVLMVAFAPHTLAEPVSGHISLGILLGLGVILAAVVLTGIYVRRANGEFDRLTQDILRSAS
ncbi:MAG TPA: DUF485 domain-containing protein [Nevskiaceae bacterium]|nr:DUF485 domain-containing protein [Nevskiaceae bacterium]